MTQIFPNRKPLDTKRVNNPSVSRVTLGPSSEGLDARSFGRPQEVSDRKGFLPGAFTSGALTPDTFFIPQEK